MTPIMSIPCRLSSEQVLYRWNSKPFVSDNVGNNKRENRNRNNVNNNSDNNNKDDDDNDNHRSSSGNNRNSNDDDNNNSNNSGGSSNGGGGNRFKFPSSSTSSNDGNNRFKFPSSSTSSNGGNSNGDNPFKFPSTSGSASSNDGDGNGDSRSKFPSTSSSTSLIAVQSTTAESSYTTTSVDISSISGLSTATFPPTATISSPSISPSSSSEDALMSQTPNPRNTRHVLPLGSIIAIILGILFCITIAGVIIVITRPKFGSLARLWKKSTAPSRYLPSTINSFEPMQQRDSSNLYRRYNPLERPQSRTFFDLQAFRFGSPGNNGIAQGSAVPRQPNNLVASNIASPSSKYDDFHTGQIYSTGMPTSSAAPVQPVTRPMSNTSKQRTYTSISRIMSMIDAFSRERGSRANSGQASFKSIEWKPPRNDPVAEGRV